MKTFKIIKKTGKEDVITGKKVYVEKEYYVIEDDVGDAIYSVRKDWCKCILPVSMQRRIE